MATGGRTDLEGGGDMTFDFLCVVCKGKNKNTEAETFCSECHDYYSSSCVKCHDVIPALKNHQILDKSTAPLPAVPTERCKDHKDKPVDMYCRNYNTVGCSTCMLKEHSSCKDKLYIPDFIKINTKASNSNSIEEQIESIAKSLGGIQEAFINEKEHLKGNKDKVLKEIGTFRMKINQLLDQFEKNIIQELEQKFKTHTDKIDSRLGELQTSTTGIKSAQDRLKSAGGNMPQMFVSIMQAKQVVSEAEQIVRTTKSQVSHTEIYFLANQKLQTLFSVIQDLGSIRERKRLRITGRQRYPVKVKSDSETCRIISACTLNDGTIILADNVNSKLKRLDSPSYSLTDFVLDQPPLQVCAISDTEVAVSVWNCLQFVTVGKIMKKTRQIKTDFLCTGLAYADERLFVCDETSVYMFSLSGKQLQQLYNDQSRQSVYFSGIRALAITSDKSRIYVCHGAKGLIILDMNGQLVGQYDGDKSACGICLDNIDNVLVCVGYSRNVLQFSPDGKLIGEVLKTDGICTAVCFNKNNSKLIVGFYEKNEIEVYDINSE